MKRINDICENITKVLVIVIIISGITNKLFWYNMITMYVTDVLAIISAIGIFVIGVYKDIKRDLFFEEGWAH